VAAGFDLCNCRAGCAASRKRQRQLHTAVQGRPGKGSRRAFPRRLRRSTRRSSPTKEYLPYPVLSTTISKPEYDPPELCAHPSIGSKANNSFVWQTSLRPLQSSSASYDGVRESTGWSNVWMIDDHDGNRLEQFSRCCGSEDSSKRHFIGKT